MSSRHLQTYTVRAIIVLVQAFLSIETQLLAEEATSSPDGTPLGGAPLASQSLGELRYPYGDMVWNFGLTGTRNALRSESSNTSLGSFGAVQFGAGYLSKSWCSFASLDFLTGPIEPLRIGELDVDYAGTSVSFWSGFAPMKKGLRSGGASFGMGVGVSYTDLVGRSMGRGRRSLAPRITDDSETLNGDVLSYVLQTTLVSVTPALFVSWLEHPRPAGNSPELLATRFEGSILSLGVGFPVSSAFSKKALLMDGNQTLERGQLEGRRIELTWTALLAP